MASPLALRLESNGVLGVLGVLHEVPGVLHGVPGVPHRVSTTASPLAFRLENNGDIAVKSADGSMWRMQGNDLYTSSADRTIRSPMGQARRLDGTLNSPAKP